MLNGRKNSNFSTLAVLWSDFMKRNYGGFTFDQRQIFVILVFTPLTPVLCTVAY